MNNTCKNYEKRNLAEVYNSARQSIKDLGIHVEEFKNVFCDDKECWRGEAAMEEQSFVSSDKQYLDELLQNMEGLINE